MSIGNVAVLGGGNVAFATAAELSKSGISVNLFELPAFEHEVHGIVERGGIEYSGVIGEGFVKLNMVTTDIEKALKNIDLILLTAPVFAHEFFVDTCLPYLEDGQVFLTETAYFACLRFAKKIKQTGRQVTVAEMNQSPYTCAKKSPSHVFIDAKRNEAFIAAIPGAADIMDKLGPLTYVYQGLAQVPNVMKTSLDNMNWIAHPPITLLHRGLIERSEDFYLPLREALPPSVIRLMEALERDRIELGRAFGIDLLPIKHTFERGGDTLEDALRHSTEFDTFGYDYKNGSCKYLEEDLLYALPAIVSIADQTGVPVPAMSALLKLYSIIDDTDYRSKGLNVKKMGIDGMNLTEIIKVMDEGF